MTTIAAEREQAFTSRNAANAERITQEPASEAIVNEVHSAISAVRNGLAMRKAHPSYGYTKASIQSDLDRATGLAQAVAVVSGLGCTSSSATTVFDALGIDFRAIRVALKAAK